ncbi:MULTISPECIES: ribonuclease III [Rothia]|nr:ribonuclease III [Rothia kristinae]KTR38668.1 ribonuclease III [Rothia kristinae]KTR56650.1 ribonuclease III [Rothia kristinae]KTR61430.1 ribonuclease III [Rothia kristinae]KTR69547.1 ribonuclease III [Rothia kristinae]KTR75177.1 ribonuclease III [Rothia kristinae]
MDTASHGELLQRLGVDIDAETLLLALTHRSYAHEHPGTPDNERLEFLGDSVLGLAVTTELYHRFPHLPEGQLAKRRAAVVSERSLAVLARGIGLGQHIRLGRGEAISHGGDKDSILADTMEALFGATFITCGPEIARDLVLRFTSPLLDDEFVLGAGRDWKTEIQELAAARGLGEVSYEVQGEGPEHARIYRATVLLGGTAHGEGSGPAKKQAERAAAEVAFRALHGVVTGA